MPTSGVRTRVLGWHNSHCASAAVVSPEGETVFAAAEERYSKIKIQKGYPRRTLEEIAGRFGSASLGPRLYVDQALGAKSARNLHMLWHSWLGGYNTEKTLLGVTSKALGRLRNGSGEPDVVPATGHMLAAPPKDAIRHDMLCEHHLAHAAGAYYHSGFDKSWILTVDGVGDCLSGTISMGEHGTITRRKAFFYNELTVGADYETLTAMIGFNPDRHCGKVTGLAAYGKHNQACIDALKAFFADSWSRGQRNWFDRMHGSEMDATLAELRRIGQDFLKRFGRDDLAFAIQWLTEDRVLSVIREHMTDIERSNIALSGGVFANVRVNQKVKELGFQNIFIQPAMDDGGLSLGAALNYLGENHGLQPQRVPHMFLGPTFDEAEMKDALDRAGLAYERAGHVSFAIARLLVDGKVVGRFDGAMEFGPRALGNRSILYSTVDPTVNAWLNKRLQRTEFMPFAPATMADHADRCYLGVQGCEHAAEFMTVTFNCTDDMKKKSPAVVHLDGTARGQLVRPDVNAGFYEILNEYHKLTGIPSLVNTSFNMHESPIIMTPADAVTSFLDGRLDYLALGPFIVKQPS